MPSSVTTFLLRPAVFFERYSDRLDGVHGAGVAVAVGVLATVILGVALRLFSRQFTGTTTVDNPAYPGDTFCEDGGVGSFTPRGCDEPATVTREISSLLWEAFADVIPTVFIGLLLLWLVLAVGLYAGAKLGGGTGTFGETMALAAWGLVPTLFVSALAGAALVAFAAQADLSASDPEALLPQVRTLQSGVSGLTLLGLQLGGAAWQAYIWASGLRVVHEVSRGAAVATAVVAAVLPVLLS